MIGIYRNNVRLTDSFKHISKFSSNVMGICEPFNTTVGQEGSFFL